MGLLDNWTLNERWTRRQSVVLFVLCNLLGLLFVYQVWFTSNGTHKAFWSIVAVMVAVWLAGTSRVRVRIRER